MGLSPVCWLCAGFSVRPQCHSRVWLPREESRYSGPFARQTEERARVTDEGAGVMATATFHRNAERIGALAAPQGRKRKYVFTPQADDLIRRHYHQHVHDDAALPAHACARNDKQRESASASLLGGGEAERVPLR